MIAIKDLHEEKLFLYTMVRVYKPKTMVEIGVSKGDATLAIAMAMRDNHKKDKIIGKLTSVDNWSRRHGGQAKTPKAAQKQLLNNNCAPYVEFRSADSQDFLRTQPDYQTDLILIDGDHSYEGALLDISEAIRVARELVIVHDSSNLDGVRRACEKFYSQIGSNSFFMKPLRGYWICEPWIHSTPELEKIRENARVTS